MEARDRDASPDCIENGNPTRPAHRDFLRRHVFENNKNPAPQVDRLRKNPALASNTPSISRSESPRCRTSRPSSVAPGRDCRVNEIRRKTHGERFGVRRDRVRKRGHFDFESFRGRIYICVGIVDERVPVLVADVRSHAWAGQSRHAERHDLFFNLTRATSKRTSSQPDHSTSCPRKRVVAVVSKFFNQFDQIRVDTCANQRWCR